MLVEKIVPEGHNAISIYLNSDSPLEHSAGQYIVLDVCLPDGRNESRAYSLFTLHGVDELPAITIKKHDNGTVSKYLYDSLRPGVKLNVSRPAGKFNIVPHADEHVFFAAGSGIAPIVSMLKQALHRADSDVTLVYVMRSDRDFLLETQIRRLEEMYPHRFSLHTWITSAQGRPLNGDLAALGRPQTVNPSVYCCGPEGFIENVQAAIQSLGITLGDFHIERFGGKVESEASTEVALLRASSVDSEATVEVFGREYSVRWPAGEKLLDVLLANKVRVPFSCREGICSACQCSVVEGQTTMLKDSGLSNDEKSSGLSLSCQLLANSAYTSVKFL